MMEIVNKWKKNIQTTLTIYLAQFKHFIYSLKHKEQRKKQLPILIIILLTLNLYQHYQSNRVAEVPLPIVLIESPKLEEVSETITLTGNTVAYNAVDLVARVEGYLEEINFVDGSYVKKGTNLFVIEPQPYFEKLKEAEATLAAQQAIYSYDTAEYARQKRMYRENATSLNNVEKWLAKSEESKAEVEKAKANVAIARINYSYTYVDAPFEGRIGRHMVDKSNLVGNGTATILATIEQFDPIYVYFNLNEIDFIKLRESARARGVNDETLHEISVAVFLPNQTQYVFEGKMNFVNTGLDANTGTMEFRALLPNKKYQLVPGLFVQIRINTSEPTKQLTVPETALLSDQIGPYVFTVDANKTVYLTRVTLGPTKNGRRAILKGLNATDQVIVEGLQSASPGGSVNPQRKGEKP